MTKPTRERIIKSLLHISENSRSKDVYSVFEDKSKGD